MVQVVFDVLRLVHQEGHVLGGGFQEALDDLQRLLELQSKAVVLLVAPGVAQGAHLPVQDQEPAVEVLVELVELVGKAAQCRRFDNGLRHGMT